MREANLASQHPAALGGVSAEEGAAVIVEALIGSVTLVTLGSLWVAKAVAAPDEGLSEKERVKAIERAYEEKKRILERERAWWMSALGSHSESRRAEVTKKIEGFDQRLLELAEARSRDILR